MSSRTVKCPKCLDAELVPWPWMDGGFKGVTCDECGGKWWSESLADRLDAVAREAQKVLMCGAEFPKDAESDEDFRKRMEALAKPKLPVPEPLLDLPDPEPDRSM